MAWTKEYQREYLRKWRAKNPEKTKEQSRQDNKTYRIKHRLKIRILQKTRRAKNPEKTSKQNKKDLKTFRIKNRNNPIYKMQQNMRSAMSAALAGKRKSQSTMNIIGCTVEELFEHLESCLSWESWMTRENYGKNGWDVDHIIPISKWSENCPLQFALCWDKSNLQPMEHIANIKKGVG
tara:strand:+ start:16 stop:552 length:537 start_codon:yes stop_codon:yes gene_type:complete